MLVRDGSGHVGAPLLLVVRLLPGIRPSSRATVSAGTGAVEHPTGVISSARGSEPKHRPISGLAAVDAELK